MTEHKAERVKAGEYLYRGYRINKRYTGTDRITGRGSMVWNVGSYRNGGWFSTLKEAKRYVDEMIERRGA